MLPALRCRSSKLNLFNTHSPRRQFYHGGRPPFSSTEEHFPEPTPNRPLRGGEDRSIDNQPLRGGGGRDRSIENRPLRGGGGGDRSFDNRPSRGGGVGDRSIDSRPLRVGGGGERSFGYRQSRGGVDDRSIDRGRSNFDSDDKGSSRNKFDNYQPGNATPHQNPMFNEERTPDFSRRPSAGPSASQKSADFLEKFKLGFDKSEKPLPNIQSDKTQSENSALELTPPPQDADEIFKKMKETGLIPNAVAMLDGLCKDGLIQEAMKLFSLMREKGTIPEVVVYTAVVDAFCKVQKLDDAIRIFKKMQNNGITPNAYTYNVLIQGLCKGENIDDALEFCLEMLESGHSPNLAAFTGLVDLLCNKNGVEEAKNVIARLKEKGYFLDEKAGREHLEKKGPFSQLVWEAIFGIKDSQKRKF